MHSPSSVAVIGAGAVGCTVAADLGTAGLDVSLFERSQVAGGTTGASAGLAYDIFHVPEDVEIAARSIERFRELDGCDSGFCFHEIPFCMLASDEKSEAGICKLGESLQNLGRTIEVLNRDELSERYPALNTEDIRTAVLTPNAGYADPHRYTMTMAKKARAAGVTFNVGRSADVSEAGEVKVGDATETFDRVIVAAGVHSREILANAGVSIPLKAYRVQAMTASPVNSPANHLREGIPMFHDTTGGFYYRPDAEGVLGGGGEGSMSVLSDPNDWKRNADQSFVVGIAEDLERRIPGYDLELTSSWAGVCAATPDGLPLVGEVVDGIYLAAGWQGHGFMRSPGFSERIVDLVLNGADSGPFDPTRFDGSEEFEVSTGMDRHTEAV